MSRAWPGSSRRRKWPNPVNGQTLCHITDTHVGARNDTDWRFPTIAADMERLGLITSGVIHTGDMCSWDETPPTGLPEVDQYRAWRDPLRSALGVPWSEVPGNHDLQSWQSKIKITAQEWADQYGYATPNTVTRMGDMIVLGCSPDEWAAFDAAPFVLSAATLAWLDEQLTAAGNTPCIITAHVPPVEQYPNYGKLLTPESEFTDLVASHDNAAMILSGHRHSNIWTDQSHVSVATFGSREVFCINGPASGGLMYGYGDPYPQAAFRSRCLSIYVTYYGDAATVHWRDQMGRQWSPGLDQDYTKHFEWARL